MTNLSSRSLFRKFGVLAACQLFIIGTYWLLRPLKDAVFASIVGLSHQPEAKILSLVIIIPLILLYNKLADLMQKHTLFYLVCTTFAGIFFGCGYLLNSPTRGLANTVASSDRYLGWVIYFSIESFGSIVVAMYWSYVALNCKTEEAKKGYPFIVTFSQIGAIIGPTISTFSPKTGIPPLFYLASFNVLIVVALLYTSVPHLVKNSEPTKPTTKGKDKEAGKGKAQKENEQSASKTKKNDSKNTKTSADQKQKSKGGMFAGLFFFNEPYVLGILFIATIYEVIGTILDYQMKILGQAEYKTPQEFAMFLGYFGQAANLLAMIFSFFGTSWIVSKWGVEFSLLVYPLAVGAVIIVVWMCPLLWAVFGAMIALKGLSYALNNPLKEMLYIPTSPDVKVKAKSWIDMFGGRFAKAVGSVVTGLFKHSADSLMFYGTTISFGLVAVWALIAIDMGKRYMQLTKSNRIIG
eukprot:TRINITY_DN2821_c0_g1_i1.p1 TRINITY_DN2821_c0_g1~~TRINITY_DN2821_c0_g1_i1.p1  ORF type:complete len:465 (-),score=88.82 TRINITY_DN2821_c0_g1_i1:88-1482(-)